MSRILPLDFQDEHINVLVSRFLAVKERYDQLGPAPAEADVNMVRHESACVLLQAPTGIGKTLMACELLARFSPADRVLWFWFAPFTGVLDQAKAALRVQAPSLTLLDIDADRHPAKLTPGATFVLSWQTVAARSRDSRLVRQDGDTGLAIDDLIAEARRDGYRIGVVVDEAHHGFVKATEAGRFFGGVLQPDYVLMMTATPRDQDAVRFAQQTKYRIGGPAEWASISRQEGVDAQLLKRSVKAARFIAQNQDDAQLVAFEEVALSECAVMHRLIKRTLAERGVGLTPLMLVQVPNGGQALAKARAYLTDVLRFPESAVRAHTSDEPDPNLMALAHDPAVEVILFKMAIATGFNAPRAFTLAALRGTRDADFGIQVVGRIMRVPFVMQGRLDELPPLLSYGYVFLANSEAQEGLIQAANQINQMPEQLASASPSTVVTIIGNQPSVQVVRPGQSLSLLPERPAPASSEPVAASSEATGLAWAPSEQSTLFQVLAASQNPGQQLLHGYAETSALTSAFQLDTQQGSALNYPLKASMPDSFITELLPPVPDDFEERVVQHIDFARVIGDRFKVRSKITERMTDIFAADSPEDRDVWATVSPIAIAERARQLSFDFDDLDSRDLLNALRARFKATLLNEGHEVPESAEELTRQLELILVRNPTLLRDAHKRVRAEQVQTATVHLPPALQSETPLTPAAKNVYGVFPPDLSPQERQFAELLDISAEVAWWHRNSVRKSDSIGLFSWSEGTGFYPDFVLGVVDRDEGGGVALSEVKGPQLQQYDKAKAGARHTAYGRVFMVGKPGAEGNFRLWRLANGLLVDDGPFEVPRLRYS